MRMSTKQKQVLGMVVCVALAAGVFLGPWLLVSFMLGIIAGFYLKPMLKKFKEMGDTPTIESKKMV